MSALAGGLAAVTYRLQWWDRETGLESLADIRSWTYQLAVNQHRMLSYPIRANPSGLVGDVKVVLTLV